MSEKRRPGNAAALRRAAERLVARRPADPAAADPAAVLDELRVHQVELEHQNHELRRVQAALERARDQYQELYDFAPVGYLTLDGEERITRVNLAGAAMLGADRAELLRQPLRLHLAAVGLPAWERFLGRLEAEGPAATVELAVQPRRGAPLYAEITAARSRGAVRCTLLDVTARRRDEEDRARRMTELVEVNRRLERTRRQLLQSDKMAAIGQLAAGVAHEFNGPLAYLGSNLQQAGQDVAELVGALREAERLDESSDHACPVRDRLSALLASHDVGGLQRELGEVLDESRHGVDRMGRLVSDLRSFAHPDTGSVVEADLNQVVDVAFRIVEGARGGRAGLVRAYAAGPLTLRCRPSQLEQVFMNLLLNAVQASDPGGVVTVRTGRREAQLFAEVEDHGPGIPPEHLGRIFEPFFTTRKIGEGTGLGLSIAYGIVRAHGGRIEVTSRLGEGSRLRVWLPVDWLAQESPPAEELAGRYQGPSPATG